MAEYIGMITTQYQTWKLMLTERSSVLIERADGKFVEIPLKYLKCVTGQLWCILDWHEEAHLLARTGVEYSAELPPDCPVAIQLKKVSQESGCGELYLILRGDSVLRVHVSKLSTVVNILRRGCSKAGIDMKDEEEAHEVRQKRMWDKLTGVDLSGIEPINLEEVL